MANWWQCRAINTVTSWLLGPLHGRAPQLPSTSQGPMTPQKAGPAAEWHRHRCVQVLGSTQEVQILGRLPGRGHILAQLYRTNELSLDKEGGRRAVLGRGVSSR